MTTSFENILEVSGNKIKIHHWKNTNSSNLVVKLMPVHKFVEYIFERLLKLKTQNFIGEQQTKFFTNKRTNLKFGEVLINGDVVCCTGYFIPMESLCQILHKKDIIFCKITIN